MTAQPTALPPLLAAAHAIEIGASPQALAVARQILGEQP